MVAIAGCAAISLWTHVGTAQDHAEDDHAVVLEAGAAGERNIKGATAANFGPALSLEVTPIEEWLEIEFGVSALGTSGHTELSSDLVFKKPFRLSSTAEFMIGLGPSVSRTLSAPDKGTSHGIEVVLDFMFWQHQNTGWYLEPSWSRNAGSGAQSIGLTSGLLFGWH
ncbi:MAG: hypothetical protein ABSG18_01660 [Steroidobacteraceae bacterium]|jgi:hypothetical protein